MRKRILSIFLTIIYVLSMFFATAMPSLALESNGNVTVVAFTSDVHHNSSKDKAAASRLTEFLNYTKETYGNIDALCVCGDLGVYTAHGDTYWTYVQRVIDNVKALGIEGIYTTGNHEHENGSYSSTSNNTAKAFTRLGLAKSTDNYEVFCMGAESTTIEFSESDIAALSTYLASVGTEKPVFILSHYPLHRLEYSEGGETKIRDPINRGVMIDLLNQYPNTFFIWGHNHSKNDPYYDYVNTDSINDKEIFFTYAAGGAMTEEDDGNKYAGDIEGKGMIALISEDGSSVSLRYVDIENKEFSEWTSDSIVKVPLNFDLSVSGDSKTINITSEIEGTQNAYFNLACYDENGKMLGTTLASKTISSDTLMIKLDCPDIDLDKIEKLKVMAFDIATLCPIGTVAVQR